MIEYKVGTDHIDFEKLVDMYDDTNMFLGLGRSRDIDKITQAVLKSYKMVSAWEKDVCIGAGRLISDGACYGWIHDVAVRESYRQKGIGSAIIKELIQGNESLLIGLTSSFMAIDFYKQLGFKKHKTAMALYPGKSDYLIYEENE